MTLMTLMTRITLMTRGVEPMRSSRVDGCDDGRGLSEEAMTIL